MAPKGHIPECSAAHNFDMRGIAQASMSILRRLRAAVVTVALWPGAWALVGITCHVMWRLESRLGWPTLATLSHIAIHWLIPGAIAGATFAGLLASTTRRQQSTDPSLAHIAVVGGVGAILVPSIALTIRALIVHRPIAWLIPILLQFAVAGLVRGCLSLVGSLRADRGFGSRLASHLTNVAADSRAIDCSLRSLY